VCTWAATYIPGWIAICAPGQLPAYLSHKYCWASSPADILPPSQTRQGGNEATFSIHTHLISHKLENTKFCILLKRVYDSWRDCSFYLGIICEKG
jgi:hypothetical protein